ncbi:MULTISPECIES: DUF6328 family protein [unclassified Streptomyces]|uniref:DUF6328 family protein n=1 Tax=unclassified Streptomyces TaxID=2593676 RepID=UPI0022B68855|nr:MULTISPECIES: DUF6328 family protein [unclassified Streptomyces]MCZ7412990.1 DUF6328 family protein [Streptomyces sp. WMMC897]MCZ7434701.1 DUF6328 family protein [Streptomyces sp. WMMC1477]
MEVHHGARNETPLERDDRNFGELLQELRVIQTGVQILFAFLLTLAFTPRFPELDDFQRGTYITTLLLAALTVLLFTAPAVVHRRLFRRGAKRRVVDVSARLAAAGLAVLGLALTGAVLLVVDFVLGRAAGLTAAGATLLACAGLWLLLPWRVRSAHTRTRAGLARDPAQAPSGAQDTTERKA